MVSEAPKKIWVWDYAADQMVNENPDSTDVPYIRADLVDGLVKEMEKLITLHDQRAYYGTDDLYMVLKYTALADPARAALKALEEE